MQVTSFHDALVPVPALNADKPSYSPAVRENQGKRH